VWIMLQSKKQSRYGAVKLLDFASTRFPLPCEKLVDLGGLKHLFGIFMGKARIKGPKGERNVAAGFKHSPFTIIMNCTSIMPRCRWPGCRSRGRGEKHFDYFQPASESGSQGRAARESGCKVCGIRV
jgi:hypothetical protein